MSKETNEAMTLLEVMGISKAEFTEDFKTMQELLNKHTRINIIIAKVRMLHISKARKYYMIYLFGFSIGRHNEMSQAQIWTLKQRTITDIENEAQKLKKEE